MWIANLQLGIGINGTEGDNKKERDEVPIFKFARRDRTEGSGSPR